LCGKQSRYGSIETPLDPLFEKTGTDSSAFLQSLAQSRLISAYLFI